MSNEIKDAREALQLYRNRDVVEKAFNNIKERLNGNRALVSSEAALEGKLFVHFLDLFLVPRSGNPRAEPTINTHKWGFIDSFASHSRPVAE